MWLRVCSAGRPRRDSRRCINKPPPARLDSDLRKLSAEAFTKGALALRRELHGTGSWQSAGSSLVHAVLANQRAEHAGEMRSPFAPIQTGPAENPPRLLGPPL